MWLLLGVLISTLYLESYRNGSSLEGQSAGSFTLIENYQTARLPDWCTVYHNCALFFYHSPFAINPSRRRVLFPTQFTIKTLDGLIECIFLQQPQYDVKSHLMKCFQTLLAQDQCKMQCT